MAYAFRVVIRYGVHCYAANSIIYRVVMRLNLARYWFNRVVTPDSSLLVSNPTSTFIWSRSTDELSCLKVTVKSFYLVLPVIISLVSCSDNSSDRAQPASDTNPEFNAFLEKIPSITLPVTIRECSVNTQGLTKIDSNKFVSETVNYGYGKLAPNNKYVAVIFLASADCEIPVLVTYDKSGNKIDEKEINIGGCGSDCGYSCNEIMRIDQNNNIFTADTVSSYDCDSLGNAIPGTEEHYVIYKQGRILETGKIELSEKIKKQL